MSVVIRVLLLRLAYGLAGAVVLGGVYYLLGFAIAYFILDLRADEGLERAANGAGLGGAVAGFIINWARLARYLSKKRPT